MTILLDVKGNWLTADPYSRQYGSTRPNPLLRLRNCCLRDSEASWLYASSRVLHVNITSSAGLQWRPSSMHVVHRT